MNGLHRLGTGVKIGLGFGLAGLLILAAFSQFHRQFAPHPDPSGGPGASAAVSTASSSRQIIQELQTLADNLARKRGGNTALPDVTALDQAAERLEKRLGSIDLDRIRTLTGALRLTQYTYLFQSERRFRDHFHRLMAELKKSLAVPTLETDLGERLRRAVLTYEAAFSGFLVDDGDPAKSTDALNRLNTTGQALTDAIEQRHVPHAGEQLLLARRHGAAFFLGNDPEQAKAFENALNTLLEYMKFTRIPEVEQGLIRTDVDGYRETFRRLALQASSGQGGTGAADAARSVREVAEKLHDAARSVENMPTTAPAQRAYGAPAWRGAAGLLLLGVLLVIAGMAWLVARLVATPWRGLATTLEEMDSGYSIDLTRRLADSGDRETGPVIEGINRILDAVAEVVQQARSSADTLGGMAGHGLDSAAVITHLQTATRELEGLQADVAALTGQANLLAVNAAIQAVGGGGGDPALAAVADNAEALLPRLEAAATGLTRQVGILQTLVEEAREHDERLRSHCREVADAGADLQRALQRLQV